jgi:hypothetical protein
MSIVSAQRRIGASPRCSSGGPSRPWLPLKFIEDCLMTWRCLEAVGVLALGTIAVVKIVDALLDGIH